MHSALTASRFPQGAAKIIEIILKARMGTSQPRIAALENADHTTLDSFFQAFRALGVSAREFGKMFGTQKPA